MIVYGDLSLALNPQQLLESMERSWLRARVLPPGSAREHALVELLVELGCLAQARLDELHETHGADESSEETDLLHTSLLSAARAIERTDIELGTELRALGKRLPV